PGAAGCRGTRPAPRHRSILFGGDQSAVVCVKFSNLIVVLGDASGEPPVSVAAVTARWVDCLQLLEVELGNGLELLRQPRPFETGRQVVQPSAVFVPQVDQRRYRRRPALGPRR